MKGLKKQWHGIWPIRNHTGMLSIVIPVFNEEECIAETHLRIISVLGAEPKDIELVYINDGSSDQTLEKLRAIAQNYPCAKVVSFSRNFGHQTAVSAGMEYAHGDAVVVIDGDLQDPPEIIPKLVEKWREGFNVVYAVRASRKENAALRFMYSMFYRMMSKMSYIKIPLDSGDFALMDRKVVNELKKMPERNRFVRGMRSWVGFKQTGLPYDRDARFSGESKYSLIKLFKLAYDGIISFSFVPLKLVSIVGFFISMVAFLSIFVVLFFRIFTDQSIPGFASTAVIVLFLGGVQLLSLGVIGEYISRIFDEVKQRPLYVVDELINL